MRGAAARAFAELPEAALRMAQRAWPGTTAVDRAIRESIRALVRFEDLTLAWRDGHAAVVRDLLDELPGTGGSAGYAYLRANRVAQPRSALHRWLGAVGAERPERPPALRQESPA